jgi:hypothetical protein
MDTSVLVHAGGSPAQRERDGWPSGLAAFALAGSLAIVAVTLGWRGSDLPAQVFRAELVRRDGFVVWNSEWFGGHATLAYSVIAPLVSALTGPVAVGAICGVVSAVLFERIVRRGFGRASLVGALWFASSTVTNLVVGRVTFSLGVALGLGAVLALQRNRAVIATVCALLCSLASPLSGLFLGIAGAACAIAQPPRRVAALTTTAAAFAPIAVTTLLFRNPGSEPYELWALIVDLALCTAVLLFVPRQHSVLRWGAAMYAAVAIAAFVIPTALGGNVSRLDQYIAGPLLACALLPRRRAFVALLAIPLLVWQWYPAIDGIAFAHRDPSTKRAYYAPLLSYLERRPRTMGRVEIPPTYRHWEAAYGPPAITLARGWERQVDIGYNPIFYEGPLTAATYRNWLVDNAVEYVALPDTRLDESALAEKELLEGGLPYLEEVWRNRDWRVWRFTGFRGLVEGPASVVELSSDGFTLDVREPATLRVRIRASRHWVVQGGADDVCVTSTTDGWTRVRAQSPGRVEIGQALTGSSCTL